MKILAAMWLGWSGLTLLSVLATFASPDAPEWFFWNIGAWVGVAALVFAVALFGPIIIVLLKLVAVS